MLKTSKNLQRTSIPDEIIFLSIGEIIQMHDEQVNLYGGLHGIRDHGLLESALFAPQASYGGTYLLDDIFHMAATYAHSIIKNHPFLDGNKRTGIATSLIFLIANGYSPQFKDEEVFDLAIQIATSQITVDELAELFRQKSR